MHSGSGGPWIWLPACIGQQLPTLYYGNSANVIVDNDTFKVVDASDTEVKKWAWAELCQSKIGFIFKLENKQAGAEMSQAQAVRIGIFESLLPSMYA